MELYGSFGEVKSSAVFLREERFPMGTGVLAGIQRHVCIMSASVRLPCPQRTCSLSFSQQAATLDPYSPSRQLLPISERCSNLLPEERRVKDLGILRGLGRSDRGR